MASSVDSADGEIGFQIAPMVDVVFVLMVFFMAAVGAQVVTRELDASFSGARHKQANIAPAIIDIATDGTVLFNSEPLGSPQDSKLAALSARFEFIRREFGDKDPVMLRPESSVRHERVVEVLSSLHAAGIDAVTFL